MPQADEPIELSTENQNKFARQDVERFLLIIKQITEDSKEEPEIKRIQLNAKKIPCDDFNKTKRGRRKK